MTNISPSEMVQIAEELYVPRVASDMATLGDGMAVLGIDALKRLVQAVRQVHLAVSTERISMGMTVVCGVEVDEPCLAAAHVSFTEASALTAYFDGSTALTVQVTRDGFFVWTDALDAPPAYEFVGYRYELPHVENIFTRRASFPVPKVAASASYFGISYFRDLKRSLEQYGETWVKDSQCEIFNAAWLDDHRIVFSPRPEYRMRRSLQRHLRSGLREHTAVAIMPEQNINETRPVDIKVTWGANRVALIEIKWLGRSARRGAARATQEHAAGRAREGASQLVDYLDLYHKELPHEEARGYLAVYDARRRNVTLPPGEISEPDASYYRFMEIDYDAGIVSRPDFELPLRFFCEVA